MGKTASKLFLVFITAILLSCNDPVFYLISQEVPKIEPLISGAPANFAKDSGGNIYTASGSSVFKYKNDSWTKENKPEGRIRQLAITDSFIYAVCDSGNNTPVLKRAALSDNLEWSSVSGINNVQTIFAIADTLYIHAQIVTGSEIKYTIYYLKDGSDFAAFTQQIDLDSRAQFLGAAFDGTNYYLCVNSVYFIDSSIEYKNGYFYSASQDFAANSFCELVSNEFMGIIRLGTGNTAAAITRTGELYKAAAKESLEDSDIIARFGAEEERKERKANGALAIWTNGVNNLLLAGRQDISYSTNTGYTYGYLEVEFDSAGNMMEQTFRIPGEAGKISTISKRERYVNSIGKNPVNHIIQAPSLDHSLIFASTQKNGVWSYRLRDGDMQWNAEN